MTQLQTSNVRALRRGDPPDLPPAADTDAVRRACRAELDATGTTITQAAREMGAGVSQATLSRWLRGTYDGDVAAVAARVRIWLESRGERERNAVGGGLDRHVALGVTEEIEQVLAYAQASGDIVIVHGPSGTGKSRACAHYAASRSGAFHVVVTDAVATMAGMLARLATAVGAGGGHGSALRAEDAVCDRLRGRSALLVVDDAHHLRRAAQLSELRCIRDRAGCGLALVGEDPLWTRIAGSEDLAALTGRTGIRWPLAAPAAADVLAIARAALGREPGPAETKLLTAAAHGDGTLHAVRRLLVRGWIVARGAGREAITAADLQAAAEEGGAA